MSGEQEFKYQVSRLESDIAVLMQSRTELSSVTASLDKRFATLLTIVRLAAKNDEKTERFIENIQIKVGELHLEITTLRSDFEKFRIQMDNLNETALRYFQQVNSHTNLLQQKQTALINLRNLVNKNADLCVRITEDLKDMFDKYDRILKELDEVKQDLMKNTTYADAVFKICSIIGALCGFGLVIKQLMGW